MRVRAQLIESATTKGSLESVDLDKLREFNEQKNEARRRREQRDAEEEGQEEEEVKEPPQLVEVAKGPVIDADGFEVVQDKKKRRR